MRASSVHDELAQSLLQVTDAHEGSACGPALNSALAARVTAPIRVKLKHIARAPVVCIDDVW